MLRKDIENQRGTINHTRIEQLFKVALLRGRKFIIEDDQVKTELFLGITQFLRTSFSYIGRYIWMMHTLNHGPNNFGPSGTRQRSQFAQ